MNITYEMDLAVEKWDGGDASRVKMTSRELEMARAYFAERRNSRQVSKINELLRVRLFGAIQTGEKI